MMGIEDLQWEYNSTRDGDLQWEYNSTHEGKRSYTMGILLKP